MRRRHNRRQHCRQEAPGEGRAVIRVRLPAALLPGVCGRVRAAGELMERRESQGGPLASITCRKVVMVAATPSPPLPDLNISGCHQRLHFRARTQHVGAPTTTRPLYFLHIRCLPCSRFARNLVTTFLSSSLGPHQSCLASTTQL